MCQIGMVPESEKVPESDKKYLKKVGGHIDRNVVQITMKMRTIVRIIQIIISEKTVFTGIFHDARMFSYKKKF